MFNLGSGLAIYLFRQPENRQNHNNMTLWVGWHQKNNQISRIENTAKGIIFIYISLSLCLYILYSYFHNKFYVIIVIFYVHILSPLSSSTDLIDLLMILLFYGINVVRRTDLMLVAEGEKRRPFHFDLNTDISIKII